MPNSSALAQLKDIHLPEPISWWPLAPGWYLLIVVGLSGLGLVLFLLYRWHARGRAKRQALKLLQIYQDQYKRHENSQETSAKINELLRRVALVYFPRVNVAGLHGEAWLDFLNGSAKDINFKAVREALLEFPYHPPGAKHNLMPFFNRSRAWIKQRRNPCLP